MFIRVTDLATLDLSVPWLLKPYLPAEGIVLLYGKKGVGKSPLTWSLMDAVGSHTRWFGFDVQRPGPVLYVEVDTPLSLVRERVVHAIHSTNVYFYAPSNPLVCSAPLEQEARKIDPVLVVLNTLRKIHEWDDKVSETPRRVYSALRRLWPRACIVCVHHEKKEPTQGQYAEGEEYSGSLAWHNDAQVALRLSISTGQKPSIDGTPVDIRNLTMTGNQAAAKCPTLKYVLGPDGYTQTLYTPSGHRKTDKTNGSL